MLAFVTCPDETKDDDLTAPPMEQGERSQTDRSGAALIAAMQASPFREVDLTPPSVRAPVSAIPLDDDASKMIERRAGIRAKIDAAENDPRPSLTDAEIEKHFAERLRRSPAAPDDPA